MKSFYNNVFKNYFLLMVTLFSTELIFRFVTDMPLVDWAVLRIFVGVNIVSLVCSAIFSLGGRIASNILTFVVALAGVVYAIAQAGFENYLGVFISIGTSSQAGAVKDYILDYFQSFSWTFWLIGIPLVLLLLFYLFADHRIKVLERNDMIDFADKFDSEERKKENDKIYAKKKRDVVSGSRFGAIFVAILLVLFYNYTLTAPFMQNEIQLKTTKELFANPDIPNIAMGQFGYTAYAFVDVKSILLPTPVNEGTSFDNGYTKIEQVPSDYTRYINDTVWESIIANEKNTNKKKLSNYFISQEITDKNDFTGIFNGKNLIVIMMESTNNIVINEEYYPNLYKLYNEGWAWKNAYSPRNACSTGNNEMSGMVSLFTVNNSCTVNRYKDNVYPQSIFNLFNNAGYTTSSYHNYTEQYYYRKIYHPNMGSQTYYGVQELGIPYSNVYQDWPSDVELVDGMLDVIENQDKFMVWMTTVSAHQPYGQSSILGNKNLKMFDNTKYNVSLKRYMSKLKEFDDSIGRLMEGLKEQGKLENTVIVLYSDHYPYGLSNSTLNSYFDYDVSEMNNADRTPFIIYNPNIKAQKFDEYTSFMNIVPTVANLFALDYDPRLYVGDDLFSNTYENRVIFADGSWRDDVAFYNSSTGKITYFEPNTTYTSEEIRKINTDIKNKISMSNLAIKEDYFNYLQKAKDEYKITENKEDTPASS